MFFIAKNPLIIPEFEDTPLPPLPNTRGLFPKKDGWYNIDSSGKTQKMVSSSDIGEMITQEAGDSENLVMSQKAVTDLMNHETDDGGVIIGNEAITDGEGVAIGKLSYSNDGGVAIGVDTQSGVGSVAIGYEATATAGNAIQIGSGRNGHPDTFQVGKYQLLDGNGKIPSDRLPASFGNNTGDSTSSIGNLEISIEKRDVGGISKDYIVIKSNDEEITSVDATAFVKDGMIESVEVSDDGLSIIITWNTDSGKDVTTLPLPSIDVSSINNLLVKYDNGEITTKDYITIPSHEFKEYTTTGLWDDGLSALMFTTDNEAAVPPTYALMSTGVEITSFQEDHITPLICGQPTEIVKQINDNYVISQGQATYGTVKGEVYTVRIHNHTDVSIEICVEETRRTNIEQKFVEINRIIEDKIDKTFLDEALKNKADKSLVESKANVDDITSLLSEYDNGWILGRKSITLLPDQPVSYTTATPWGDNLKTLKFTTNNEAATNPVAELSGVRIASVYNDTIDYIKYKETTEIIENIKSVITQSGGSFTYGAVEGEVYTVMIHNHTGESIEVQVEEIIISNTEQRLTALEEAGFNPDSLPGLGSVYEGTETETVKVDISDDNVVSATVKQKAINDSHIADNAGIQKAKLSSSVQDSLSLANTAVQPSALGDYLTSEMITQEAGNNESLVMSQKAVTDLVTEALGNNEAEYETVTSTDQMTDTTKQYVMNGTVWTYGKFAEATEAQNRFIPATATINTRHATDSTSSANGYFVTDYIEVKDFDTFDPYIMRAFRSDGVGFNDISNVSNCRVHYFDANENLLGNKYLRATTAAATNDTSGYTDSDGNVYWHIDECQSVNGPTGVPVEIPTIDHSAVKYVRITLCMNLTGEEINADDIANVVITFDADAGTTIESRWYDTGLTPENASGGNYVDLLVKTNQNASNIADVSNRVTILETSVGNEIVVPTVWEEAVQTCISAIKEKQVGKNCITFPFFSDNHQRLGHAGVLIAKVMQECNIPYCFYGGDSISNDYIANESIMIAQDKAFDDMMKAIPNGRFCRAVGNHDGFWNVSGTASDGDEYYYTDAQNYELFLREESISQNKHFGGDGTYYYVDDIASKVRFIVLDTNDGNVEEEQIDWLRNTALSFNERGWAVVFISHQPISNHYHAGIGNAETVRSVVKGYIDGTHKNKASIVGWFSGHIHRDRIYTGVATNITDDTEGDALGFTQVTITSDANIDYDRLNGATDLDRDMNGDTSHAIDFVTINKTTREVTLTRLGIGDSRSFTYEPVEESDTPDSDGDFITQKDMEDYITETILGGAW